ncbi:tetratricopeptide repeat protein [Falsiroseomonas sp. CW058]|uniref:O-linked N-acetylglucosamine transferase, SPINDLY family protein n=1 Tax=Falsiroseomonas sp. CW058 TaxID=3388664 RepID=UPI003D31BFF0
MLEMVRPPEMHGPAAAAGPLTATIDMLEQDPTRPEHWRDFVAALAEAGLLEAAWQALGQAVALGLPRATAGALEILLRVQAEHGAPRNAPDATPEAEQPPAPARPAAPPPGLLAHSRRLFAMFRQGRHADAAALARRVARRWPGHVAGHEFLAAALEAQGRWEEAIPPARRIVSLLPGDTGARMRLDRLIGARGGVAAPGQAAGFGTATLPADAAPAAEAWQRANRLHREGRLEEAIAAYREADAICPDIAELKHALAALLQATGRLEESSAALARAVALKPASLHLRQAHGGVLLQRLLHEEAAAAFREALRLDPENGESLVGLASALKVTGPLSEAEAAARRAIALGEDSVSAHSTLGHVLQLQGRTEEALVCFRAALSRDPEDVLAGSGLLFCETHSGTATPAALFRAHRAYGEGLERRVAPMHHDRRERRHAGAPRLGFVSGDLRAHAVSHFVAPFLFELSSRGFELHAYSTIPSDDHVSAHLKRAFAGWTEAHSLPDEGLAQRIAADRIDILFDLSGHTAHHRLPVFARRAAPVQVSWIGYPGTTGLARMDYFLCNAMLAPHGLLEAQFTEKLVRLPFSTVFEPFRSEPGVGPLPALAKGHVTFGSFNRLSKVTAEVIALWSRILHAVPDARLMVAAIPDAAAEARLRAAFAVQGIDAARLVLHQRTGFDRYLALHGEVDLLLDTFPYAGGTSTCFAQWMGVPTLTLAGGTMQSRVGASLMAHLGLHGFIAESADDYAAKAVAWAARPGRLAEIRSTLRHRLALGMTDARRVVDGLEVALHGMWRRWCHGLPAEGFDVTLPTGSVLDAAADD